MDIENPSELIPYLLKHKLIAGNETPALRHLAGGVSNRTVLVNGVGRSFVLKQALSKLRVATDWFSSPERIHIEALGLRWLVKLTEAGSITPLLFEDSNQHVIAMEAVPEPHQNWKTMLMHGEIHCKHISDFASLLGQIHRNSVEQRDVVARVFADRSYFETLRLEPYYRFAAEQDAECQEFLFQLIEDTWATQISLVHGDYSPKNILIYGDRLVLLDHEVVHFGDPAFDIGFSLTHLLSKAHHFEEQRELYVNAAQLYIETYFEAAGDLAWRQLIESRAVRHTIGCIHARVAGRSTLEYLSEAERHTQRRTVLALMKHPPSQLPDLIFDFIERLRCPK